MHWHQHGVPRQRHSLKLATTKYKGGVSRPRIVVQVVPPGLNEGAPTRGLAQHPQALRDVSSNRSDFYGWPQRRVPMRHLSHRRAGRLPQWRK